MQETTETQTQPQVQQPLEWTQVLSMFDAMYSVALRYAKPHIKQMVDDATAPLLARIAALEEKIQAGENRIQEIADDAARMVLAEHTEEYDHDGYDRLEDKIDDKVEEAIDDYDFDDKFKEVLRNATVSIDI